VCAAGLGIAAAAPAETFSKRGYYLLNPVPAAHLRELNTDRPDKTESPYTVDAGHGQIETDIVAYSYDRSRTERVERYSVAAMNLKAGVLPNLDFQLLLETYNWERRKEHLTGARQWHDGFGDLTMRLKLNLWGNDDGPTAFAVLPFLKVPTNQGGLGNEAVEGGVILPLAVALPWGFDMGVMTEVDINADADRHGYHPECINSVTFSHDIIGNLNGYAEFFSAVSTDRHAPWIGTVDVGLTYQLTTNIELDAGVNIGVTSAADDVIPFVGISARF
jgi:hypothetical protein